jgi:hypothetical protein
MYFYIEKLWAHWLLQIAVEVLYYALYVLELSEIVLIIDRI